MRTFAFRDDKFIPALQTAAVVYDLSKLRGVDENKLLKGTGIFKDDLCQADCLLSPEQILKLLRNFKQLMPGSNSSFLLGHRLFPTLNASLNGSLMHSKNLASALRILSLNRIQLCPFIHGFYTTHNGLGYFILNDSFGWNDQSQYLLEIYCTLLVSTCKNILGTRVPFTFNFPFPRPRHIQEYEENLGFRLNFNAPLLSISFELKHLALPLPNASQTLHIHAMQEVKRIRNYQYGFLEKVRIILFNQNTNLSQTADLLNTSPATLKRKLSQHQTSFQKLQDEINQQKALFMLTIRSMKNEAIASELDFNDVTNFRRAFKRWTGKLPSELRV